MYDKCTKKPTLFYISITMVKIAKLCGHIAMSVQETLSWTFQTHYNNFSMYIVMFKCYNVYCGLVVQV